MKFHYLALLLLISTTAFAQKGKIKRAHHEFDKFNYEKAITFYLEILDKQENKEVTIKLADAYRRIQNWQEAEYWYAKIVEYPDAKPIWMLYYGQALKANGKCSLAEEWFKKYEKDHFDPRAGRIPRCDSILNIMLTCPKCYEVKSLPINTQYDDYAPVLYDKGIVFTSHREVDEGVRIIDSWTGNPFFDIFYTPIDTLDYFNHEYLYHPRPKEFSFTNSKYNDGPVSFSEKQDKIFITRNQFFGDLGDDELEILMLKIFIGDIKDGKCENLNGLPFNSDEYSVADPSFDEGRQRLYFASDMPGGFGGMDLYYSNFEDGQWSPPINLGPRINDENHQSFPFYHKKSDKLYFTSNGHKGFGGLDIYFAFVDEWSISKPFHLDAPINSKADDFAIYWNADGDFGYLSSNREGGKGGDDIYSIKKTMANATLTVFDKASNQPISGATVKIPKLHTQMYTKENGQIQLDLPFDDCFVVELSHTDYEPTRLQICTKKTKMRQVLEASKGMEAKR